MIRLIYVKYRRGNQNDEANHSPLPTLQHTNYGPQQTVDTNLLPVMPLGFCEPDTIKGGAAALPGLG